MAQNAHGRANGLFAAGGVEHRCLQGPVLHQLQAIAGTRKPIDPNDADARHPAQLLRHLVGRLAHGVVVRENQVHVGVGAQHSRQARQHRRRLPVAFYPGHDFQARVRGQRFPKALVALGSRRRARAAQNLQHPAPAVQQLRGVVAGGAAHFPVVAPHVGRVQARGGAAVQYHHRNALVVGGLGQSREGARLVR